MAEKKRKQNVSFRCNQETQEKLKQLTSGSDLTISEFFEDMVRDAGLRQQAKNERIPNHLRKYFSTDIERLKTATNTILSIFTVQMESISTERDKWEKGMEKIIDGKNQQIKEREETIQGLEEKCESFSKEIGTLGELYLSELSKKEERLKLEHAREVEEIRAECDAKISVLENQIYELQIKIKDNNGSS